jgi:hypothetical protein
MPVSRLRAGAEQLEHCECATDAFAQHIAITIAVSDDIRNC